MRCASPDRRTSTPLGVWQTSAQWVTQLGGLRAASSRRLHWKRRSLWCRVGLLFLFSEWSASVRQQISSAVCWPRTTPRHTDNLTTVITISNLLRWRTGSQWKLRRTGLMWFLWSPSTSVYNVIKSSHLNTTCLLYRRHHPDFTVSVGIIGSSDSNGLENMKSKFSQLCRCVSHKRAEKQSRMFSGC